MNLVYTAFNMRSPEIHHPREYFAAAVLFAWRVAQLANMPILDAINQYTGLYREVTGREGLDGGIDPLWKELEAQLESLHEPEAITQLLYGAYLQQPHSLYRPGANTLNASIFGALGYVYLAELRQARMHFFPTRSGDSALSSRHFDERRADFRRLLLELRAQHAEAETIKSSTWLQNLPNYRNLFPQPFRARLQNIGGSTYIGIWGQFVRSDGSGNRQRLEQFRANLMQAQSVAEAVDAFPFKVLEDVGPIHEFYEEYDLGTR
jgi:hypothetical protein